MTSYNTASEDVWRIIREQIAQGAPRESLAGARIRVAFTDARPGADCLRFGRVKVMSDWERFLTGDGDQNAGDDVMLLVNATTWETLGSVGRQGCVAHLLRHIFRDEEKGGYGIARHDISEFSDVLTTYGAWDQSVIAQYRRVQQMTLPDQLEQVPLAEAGESAGHEAQAEAKPRKRRGKALATNGEVSELLEAEPAEPAEPAPASAYVTATGGEYTLTVGSLCTECRDGQLQARGEGIEGLRCPNCGSVFRPLDADDAPEVYDGEVAQEVESQETVEA